MKKQDFLFTDLETRILKEISQAKINLWHPCHIPEMPLVTSMELGKKGNGEMGAPGSCSALAAAVVLSQSVLLPP